MPSRQKATPARAKAASNEAAHSEGPRRGKGRAAKAGPRSSGPDASRQEAERADASGVVLLPKPAPGPSGWARLGFLQRFERTAGPGVPILKLEGVGDVYAKRLESQGIADSNQLLENDAQTLARATRIPVKEIRKWQDMADLVHLGGVGPQAAEALVRVDINSVAELARQDPDALCARLESFLASLEVRIIPEQVTPKKVRKWVEEARRVAPPPPDPGTAALEKVKGAAEPVDEEEERSKPEPVDDANLAEEARHDAQRGFLARFRMQRASEEGQAPPPVILPEADTVSLVTAHCAHCGHHFSVKEKAKKTTCPKCHSQLAMAGGANEGPRKSRLWGRIARSPAPASAVEAEVAASRQSGEGARPEEPQATAGSPRDARRQERERRMAEKAASREAGKAERNARAEAKASAKAASAAEDASIAAAARAAAAREADLSPETPAEGGAQPLHELKMAARRRRIEERAMRLAAERSAEQAEAAGASSSGEGSQQKGVRKRRREKAIRGEDARAESEPEHLSEAAGTAKPDGRAMERWAGVTEFAAKMPRWARRTRTPQEANADDAQNGETTADGKAVDAKKSGRASKASVVAKATPAPSTSKASGGDDTAVAGSETMGKRWIPFLKAKEPGPDDEATRLEKEAADLAKQQQKARKAEEKRLHHEAREAEKAAETVHRQEAAARAAAEREAAETAAAALEAAKPDRETARRARDEERKQKQRERERLKAEAERAQLAELGSASLWEQAVVLHSAKHARHDPEWDQSLAAGTGKRRAEAWEDHEEGERFARRERIKRAPLRLVDGRSAFATIDQDKHEHVAPRLPDGTSPFEHLPEDERKREPAPRLPDGRSPFVVLPEDSEAAQRLEVFGHRPGHAYTTPAGFRIVEEVAQVEAPKQVRESSGESELRRRRKQDEKRQAEERRKAQEERLRAEQDAARRRREERQASGGWRERLTGGRPKPAALEAEPAASRAGEPTAIQPDSVEAKAGAGRGRKRARMPPTQDAALVASSSAPTQPQTSLAPVPARQAEGAAGIRSPSSSLLSRFRRKRDEPAAKEEAAKGKAADEEAAKADLAWQVVADARHAKTDEASAAVPDGPTGHDARGTQRAWWQRRRPGPASAVEAAPTAGDAAAAPSMPAPEQEAAPEGKVADPSKRLDRDARKVAKEQQRLRQEAERALAKRKGPIVVGDASAPDVVAQPETAPIPGTQPSRSERRKAEKEAKAAAKAKAAEEELLARQAKADQKAKAAEESRLAREAEKAAKAARKAEASAAEESAKREHDAARAAAEIAALDAERLRREAEEAAAHREREAAEAARQQAEEASARSAKEQVAASKTESARLERERRKAEQEAARTAQREQAAAAKARRAEQKEREAAENAAEKARLEAEKAAKRGAEQDRLAAAEAEARAEAAREREQAAAARAEAEARRADRERTLDNQERLLRREGAPRGAVPRPAPAAAPQPSRLKLPPAVARAEPVAPIGSADAAPKRLGVYTYDPDKIDALLKRAGQQPPKGSGGKR